MYLNEAALHAYAEAHPRCEACGGPPMPTPHHLIRRARGGDHDHNLLRLCWDHHIGPNGWHTLGAHVWADRFLARLAPDAAAKVLHVTGRRPRRIPGGISGPKPS